MSNSHRKLEDLCLVVITLFNRATGMDHSRRIRNDDDGCSGLARAPGSVVWRDYLNLWTTAGTKEEQENLSDRASDFYNHQTRAQHVHTRHHDVTKSKQLPPLAHFRHTPPSPNRSVPDLTINSQERKWTWWLWDHHTHWSISQPIYRDSGSTREPGAPREFRGRIYYVHPRKQPTTTIRPAAPT